ncbi:MAG: DNA repair protein RecN [Terrimicrobiaceae bacterium]
MSKPTGRSSVMPATLTSLRIRNLALVEDLSWEPGHGFTAITGETGAGKSVIIGALNLLIGERADKSLIRSGAGTCTVEAVFDGIAAARLVSVLDEAGVEPCEDGRLLLKRSLSTEGSGRQFVNGSPCTLALLRSLGVQLVDLHGPHDHQSLFSRDQQTRLLDSFAGAEHLRSEVFEARRHHAALEREHREIHENEQSALREIDLLTHQTSEITSAGLIAGEEESLVSKHRAAANATRLLQLCAGLSAKLSGEEFSLIHGISDAVRSTRELSKLDPAAEALVSLAETASESLAELDTALQTYAGDVDADPAALTAVEARLDVIQTLKRKYGASIPEILEFNQQATSRLNELQGRAARSGELDTEIQKAADLLKTRGAKLSAKRQEAARTLEKKVTTGLKDLGFAKCEFSISLEKLQEPGPQGMEVAEFVFSPNPGEQAHPLRAIASSGEISRVMLALKGALAEQDDVPLLVFDEIDSNVGGEIATRVAARMRDLSANRQVLCITHLPQVAASAHNHFVVSKEVYEGRTKTSLHPTQPESRITEIARMLGGKSATAIAHAKDLLAHPS